MSNQRFNPLNIGNRLEFTNIAIAKVLPNVFPNPPGMYSIRVVAQHKKSGKIVTLAEFPFVFPNIQRYHVDSGGVTSRLHYPEILSEQQAASLANDYVRKLSEEYNYTIPSDAELTTQLDNWSVQYVAKPTDNSNTDQKNHIDAASQTDNSSTLFGTRCECENKFSIKLNQGPHSQQDSYVVVDVPYVVESTVDSNDQQAKKPSTGLTKTQANYIGKIILNHLTSTLKGIIPTDEEIEKLHSFADPVNERHTVPESFTGKLTIPPHASPLTLTEVKIYLAKHHKRYVDMCYAISLTQMTHRPDIYFHFFPNTQSVLTVTRLSPTETLHSLISLSDIVCSVDWSELRTSANITAALKNMHSFVAREVKKFYTWEEFAVHYLSQTAD